MDVDIPFSEEDRKRLADALGPGQDADQLAILLAKAGASELLALATGRAVPATLADARLFRIFNLLEQGMTLTAAEVLVAAIFKVPAASARRMVAATVARYAVELQKGVQGEVDRVLGGAVWDKGNDRWNVTLSIVFIRDRVLQVAAGLPLPDPVKGPGTVWRFPDETYQAVRKAFGLPAKAKK